MVPALTPLASLSSLIFKRPLELIVSCRLPVASCQWSCQEAALGSGCGPGHCACLLERVYLFPAVAQAREHLIGVLSERWAGVVCRSRGSAQLDRDAQLPYRAGSGLVQLDHHLARLH